MPCVHRNGSAPPPHLPTQKGKLGELGRLRRWYKERRPSEGRRSTLTSSLILRERGSCSIPDGRRTKAARPGRGPRFPQKLFDNRKVLSLEGVYFVEIPKFGILLLPFGQIHRLPSVGERCRGVALELEERHQGARHFGSASYLRPTGKWLAYRSAFACFAKVQSSKRGAVRKR